MSYTPGPWETYSYVVGNTRLYGVRNATMGASNPYPGHLVAATSPLPKAQRGTVLYSWQTDNEADARLIASAPDLLMSLREVLAHSELPAGVIRDRAIAAIAKAEGGEVK